MEQIEEFLLYYVDRESAKNLRTCSSLRLCERKLKVCKIENWWKKMLLVKWVHNVYEQCGLPYKRQNLTCKMCKTRPISDAVYMNTKLLFSCSACYAGIEADVISEVYPQLYSPLHTAYVLFVERGRIDFNNMMLEEYNQYENCRTQ